MATRPTASKIETLQDLSALLEKATPAVLKAWAAEDKKKKKTGGVNAPFVQKLRADLRALAGAKTLDTKAATVAERRARAALRGPLQSIRDDVAETLPDESELKRAFGVGKKLSDDSTPVLLKAAGDVASAFASHASEVAAAGVTQTRIDEVGKLRDALAAADSSQRDRLGERKASTAKADALFSSVRKRAALLRKRLAKGAPKGALRSTARRHAPKKRGPKLASGGA